jgi:cytosine/adenosine deaminase-related metal-dependent hydrolase
MTDPAADPAADPTHVTPGLVCAHHHLYSALARGMPAPPRTPGSFREILELVWWRLDVALDLDIIAAGARLGALEALESGCTAIIDHHESPRAIEGSLSVIADACAEVGVRVSCSYGVTDRHGPAGRDAGLAENGRHLRDGGLGLVGIHAAFTCGDDTLEAAAGLAEDLGVGVHVHVAEGPDDDGEWERLVPHSRDDWLLVHGVRLPDDHGLRGTVVHAPRSNMNNAVGYARPARFRSPVALGTDGIGADMLEEFRVGFARAREDDVTTSPDLGWSWLAEGWHLMPGAARDRVRWSAPASDPWSLAYTTDVRPVEVVVDGEIVLGPEGATRVDADEVRARATEAAATLFGRL